MHAQNSHKCDEGSFVCFPDNSTFLALIIRTIETKNQDFYARD